MSKAATFFIFKMTILETMHVFMVQCKTLYYDICKTLHILYLHTISLDDMIHVMWLKNRNSILYNWAV